MVAPKNEDWKILVRFGTGTVCIPKHFSCPQRSHASLSIISIIANTKPPHLNFRGLNDSYSTPNPPSPAAPHHPPCRTHYSRFERDKFFTLAPSGIAMKVGSAARWCTTHQVSYHCIHERSKSQSIGGNGRGCQYRYLYELNYCSHFGNVVLFTTQTSVSPLPLDLMKWYGAYVHHCCIKKLFLVWREEVANLILLEGKLRSNGSEGATNKRQHKYQ